MSNIFTVYLNLQDPSSNNLPGNNFYYFGVFDSQSSKLGSTGFIRTINTNGTLNTNNNFTNQMTYNVGDYMIIIKADTFQDFYLCKIINFDKQIVNGHDNSGNFIQQLAFNTFGTPTSNDLYVPSSTVDALYNGNNYTIANICDNINQYVGFINSTTTQASGQEVYGPIDSSKCNGYVLGTLYYDSSSINENICVSSDLIKDLRDNYPSCPKTSSSILFPVLITLLVLIIIVIIIFAIIFFRKHKAKKIK